MFLLCGEALMDMLPRDRCKYRALFWMMAFQAFERVLLMPVKASSDS